MSKRQERFRVVSVHDEAIDTARMTAGEMATYIDARDEKLIAPFIKPGAQPMWFHVGEIQRRLWSPFVNAVDVDSVRFERAFMAGISMVENVPQDDGPVLPTWVPDDRSKLGAMSDKSLERFDPGVVDEIGCVVWDHSFLARKTARSYRLPHTSRVALSARDFRRAESSPSSQATSSDAASSESLAVPGATVNTTEQSAGSIANPTDATATETQSATAV